MADELTEYLASLNRDACFRVDAVLKQSDFEITQRVFFVGENGAEAGPFIRKQFPAKADFGTAYDRIFSAQRSGRRFLFLPRIIDCYDVDDAHVVIMEHVGGMTLDKYVHDRGPSLDLAAQVFPLLCDAVSELHESFTPPVIHRDLKPSNIIVTPQVTARENGGDLGDTSFSTSNSASAADSAASITSASASTPAPAAAASTSSAPSLTIIDFGIARTYHDGAEEDTRHFGTRAWAPPEQFGFRQTDVRSDVYALGLLLYFCLTGKTPDADAQKLAFADPSYPEAIRRVIATAAAFDPANRYASARDVRDAFLSALTACTTSGVHDGGRLGASAATQGKPLSTPYDKMQATAQSEPRAQSESRTQGESHYVRDGAQSTLEGNAKDMQPNSPEDTSSNPAQNSPQEESQIEPKAAQANAKPQRSRASVVLNFFRNVIVIVAFLVFFAACTDLTVNPRPGDFGAEMTLIARIRGYYGILFLIVGPCLYLIADRRPLKERFPALARAGTLREVLACIILIVIGFIVVGTV